MEQKILRNISKKKLLNHTLQNGKKQLTEKNLTKSVKQAQRERRKKIALIIKLSILNATPVFRITKLRNKRRKKNSIKEIPTFLSHDTFRLSWGIKALLQKTTKETLKLKLKNKFLSATYHDTTLTKELKDDTQKKALKEKKYFKFYRW